MNAKLKLKKIKWENIPFEQGIGGGYLQILDVKNIYFSKNLCFFLSRGRYTVSYPICPKYPRLKGWERKVFTKEQEATDFFFQKIEEQTENKTS